MMKITKIKNADENNVILKFYSDRIHCLFSLAREEDFLKSFRNSDSGIQIEDEMIILDVRNLKVKNTRVVNFSNFSKNNTKMPLILTDVNFVITRINIIGIRGSGIYPVGIYYDNAGQKIFAVGAIRLSQIDDDLANLEYIIPIIPFFTGMLGKGKIQVMIGPNPTNKFESVIETIENGIKTMKKRVEEAKIYCCDYGEYGELKDMKDKDEDMKIIFYFNLL